MAAAQVGAAALARNSSNPPGISFTSADWSFRTNERGTTVFPNPLSNALNALLVNENFVDEASIKQCNGPPAMTPQDFAAKLSSSQIGGEQLAELTCALFNVIYKHAVVSAAPPSSAQGRLGTIASTSNSSQSIVMTSLFSPSAGLLGDNSSGLTAGNLGAAGLGPDEPGNPYFEMSTQSAMHKSVYQLSGVADCEDGMGTIAQFEILAELGRGAFGVVSLGVDIDEQPYAIKTLNWGKNYRRRGQKRGSETAENSCNTSVTTSSSAFSSLQSGKGPHEDTSNIIDREIALLKKIKHQNCVRLHAVIDDVQNKQVHMVMQYIENGPLTSIRGDNTCRTLPVDEALNYMSQVSAGLDYLHRHNIIHRDIKPENILIGKDQTAYVADFGVSGVVSEMKQMRRIGRAGTMPFQSPELIECQTAAADYGKESDVWAFGVTLYAAIVGKLPFQGWNLPNLVKNILEKDLEFPEEANISKEVQDVIRQLMHKDPLKRMTLNEFRHHPTVRALTGRGEMVHFESVEQTDADAPFGVDPDAPRPDAGKRKSQMNETVAFRESNAHKLPPGDSTTGIGNNSTTSRGSGADMWTDDAPFPKPKDLDAPPFAIPTAPNRADVDVPPLEPSAPHGAKAGPPRRSSVPPSGTDSMDSSTKNLSSNSKPFASPPSGTTSILEEPIKDKDKGEGKTIQFRDGPTTVVTPDDFDILSATPSRPPSPRAEPPIVEVTAQEIRAATQRCSVIFTRPPVRQLGAEAAEKVGGFVNKMRRSILKTSGNSLLPDDIGDPNLRRKSASFPHAPDRTPTNGKPSQRSCEVSPSSRSLTPSAKALSPASGSRSPAAPNQVAKD